MIAADYQTHRNLGGRQASVSNDSPRVASNAAIVQHAIEVRSLGHSTSKFMFIGSSDDISNVLTMFVINFSSAKAAVGVGTSLRLEGSHVVMLYIGY